MPSSRKEFIDNINKLVKYWSKVGKNKKDATQGVVFSIMCMFDGVSTLKTGGYTIIDNETKETITIENRQLHNDID